MIKLCCCWLSLNLVLGYATANVNPIKGAITNTALAQANLERSVAGQALLEAPNGSMLAGISQNESLAFGVEATASNEVRTYSRRRSKRFLAFPDGASLSVAVCFTVGIIGNPRFNYMAFGLNWGVAYDLPNITWVLNHLHGFDAHSTGEGVIYRRRSRRSLYKEIEMSLDYMGYNGRDCILRALCESRLYFQRTKMNMLGEMLRVIFSLPKQRVYTRELHDGADILDYDRAFRRRRQVDDCMLEYDCSFSLLELAFGKYSEPPPDYIREH